MRQSETGGDDDALDRLVRRDVFQPVTPNRDDRAKRASVDPEDGAAQDVRPHREGTDFTPNNSISAPQTFSADSPHDNPPKMGQIRDSIYLRLFVIAVVMAIGFLVVRGVLEGIGSGAMSLFDRVVALDDPFPPVPKPTDPIVIADLGLYAAARVAAPLVLAVLWLMGGYQIDRAARRAFRVGGPPGTRMPLGYGATAVGCVFPLLVFGIVGVAWGGINLAVWAIHNQAWAPAGMLLALITAFAMLIRGLVAWQDRQDLH